MTGRARAGERGAAVVDFVLVLLVLRMLWRWTHAVPKLPADTPRWEQVAARSGHIGLYVLMLATTVGQPGMDSRKNNLSITTSMP